MYGWRDTDLGGVREYRYLFWYVILTQKMSWVKKGFLMSLRIIKLF